MREEAVEWARNLRTQPDSDGNPAFDAVSHTAKIAYFGASQFEQVRRKMQAAAYTVHGADVAGLFARFDRNCNGELSPEELHAAVTLLREEGFETPTVERKLDKWGPTTSARRH